MIDLDLLVENQRLMNEFIDMAEEDKEFLLRLVREVFSDIGPFDPRVEFHVMKGPILPVEGTSPEIPARTRFWKVPPLQEGDREDPTALVAALKRDITDEIAKDLGRVPGCTRYLYCPYVPFTFTPTIGPDGARKLLSRYGKRAI